MKSMKKIASLLLALAMIFALATTAFADGTNSITVNSAKSGETYSAYKMFDLKVNNEDDPTAFTYTINAGWAAFFADGGAGHDYIVMDGDFVTDITNAEDLAKAAAAWTGKPAAAKTVTVAENANTAVLSGLDNGYWLITSTLGTFAMAETTPAKEAVTVNEKNEIPTQEKKVLEETDGKWGTESDGQIGETVNYQVTINAKKGTTNYVLHDTMDKGLTFNEDITITQNGTPVPTGWTLVKNPTDGCTFEIELNFLNGADNASEVIVTYSATINNEAVIADDGNKNDTVLKYGHNSETTHSTVKTFVWKMPVFKYTGDNKTPLAGAKFSLFTDEACSAENIVKMNMVGDTYKVAADGTVSVIETDETGAFVIEGLDSGTYYLQETEAPAGYNKLTAPIKVDIANDGSIEQNDVAATQVAVENKTGTELPSTGGMGTTLFYIVGGVLVAAAAVLLVTKKRMASAN